MCVCVHARACVRACVEQLVLAVATPNTHPRPHPLGNLHEDFKVPPAYTYTYNYTLLDNLFLLRLTPPSSVYAE